MENWEKSSVYSHKVFNAVPLRMWKATLLPVLKAIFLAMIMCIYLIIRLNHLNYNICIYCSMCSMNWLELIV